MNKRVTAATPRAIRRDLALQLFSGMYSGLPVVDVVRKAIGVMSEFGLLNAVQAGRDLQTIKAEEIMSRTVVCAQGERLALAGAIHLDAIAGELDVVLMHKLGAPERPELAIGAVDEAGHLYLSQYVHDLGVSQVYIAMEKEAQLETLRKRRAL